MNIEPTPPLPVVSCGIFRAGGKPIVVHHADEVLDMPAVAIPWALLEDPAFADAILARTDTAATEYERDEWAAALLADLQTIAAELRARAVLPQEEDA